jgi:hypothetical protein
MPYGYFNAMKSWIVIPILALFTQVVLAQDVSHDGLIAYWPLDGNTQDASGNGHNGQPGAVDFFADRHGNSGKALGGNTSSWHTSFDVSNPESFNFQDSFSISLWIKPMSDLDGYGRVISKYHWEAKKGYALIFNAHKLSFWWFEPGSDEDKIVRISDSLEYRQWYHVAVTWNGSIVKMFLNGISAAEGAMTGPINHVEGRMKVGGDGEYFQHYPRSMGYDDIYVFSRALDENEVATLAGLNTIAISTQPQSQMVIKGGALELSISATSETALTYQWFKDGSAIPGATNATLTVPSTDIDTAGTYWVEVSNGDSQVKSDEANISVAIPQDLAIFHAIELNFSTEIGVQYQLQGSNDLSDWQDLGDPVEGDGSDAIRFHSTKDAPMKFYRCIALP